MNTRLAGYTAANIDEEQATRVVTRDLMRLKGHSADEFNLDEQAQAELMFGCAVAARVCERRLERLTLDRALMKAGDRALTWTASYHSLVHEQTNQTRQLVDALLSLRGQLVRRPDGMFVKLPGYNGRINKLRELLSRPGSA